MAIALVSVTQTTAVIAELTFSSSAKLVDLGQSLSWVLAGLCGRRQLITEIPALYYLNR